MFGPIFGAAVTDGLHLRHMKGNRVGLKLETSALGRACGSTSDHKDEEAKFFFLLI